MGNPTGAAKRIPKMIAPELGLTEKQRSFALHIADGKSLQLAAKLAGYSVDKNGKTGGAAVYRTLDKPEVQALIQIRRAQAEKMMDVSRKKVLDGFLEAIEQAKTMAEPMTQIVGWREIGKMCGYYAPETKNINVNVSAQRVLSQFETLSDADLLEVIESSAVELQEEATEAALMLPSAAEVAERV